MRRRGSRTVRTIAAFGGAVLFVHVAYLALGIPGGRAISDVLFVVVPAGSTWACVRAARRLRGRARLVWGLLASAGLSWFVANVAWGWYELIRHVEVPTPSVADWAFSAALVLSVVGMVAGILPLVHSRAGALRVVLDVVLVGGALLFLAWAAVLGGILDDGDTSFTATVTWLYPALGVIAASVALATMTRVAARDRLPWLLLCVAFLANATADTVWAYENVTGGYSAGSLLDPLWMLAYGMVGLSALAVGGDAGLSNTRITPARWESLGAYLPVTAALVVAAIQQLRGTFTQSMVSVGVGLVGVLVVRQVLAILENLSLAQTLESRVADATAELRVSEEHFRSIVASISDVVLILDGQRKVRYQSPAAERVLGYAPDELLGLGIEDISHPDDLAEARTRSAATLGVAGRTTVHLARFVRRDGAWAHMEVTVTDLLDHPSVQGLVVALRDVGDRVELEDRLRHQAFHDGLTGLANRALLHEELDHLLAAGRRPSLLLLDLDEFKALNDTAGHDLGDDVLVAVAGRLIDSTRPGDLVSRLGGDEFAIVLHDDPHAHAGLAVAERMLHSLRMPLVVQGRHVRCLGSVGVAAADEHATAAGLLRDADTAMYVAKAKGKGRIELFTPTMRDAVVRRQRIEELVRRAIPECRLVLLYQPVVDLAADAFVGAEALLRLRGDSGELISPVEFIPVAEETGVIVEIGAWVLTEACRQLSSWQGIRPDGPPLDIAVNVSTRQLQDAGLARAVAAALEVADLSPSLLTLEITEGSLGAADPAVDATLLALRELGVRLSIDDFGAGYSSLARLRHLPVDELKIDRSFVAELGDGSEAPLVDAILAMARRLGLTVVAEGIETGEQADYLRARCDRGQGFLFARPLPPAEAAAVLAGSPADARARAR
ncbi:MAG: putative diguanylate cyclase/phosphodiesterase with sensor [Acidimicrobiales bacterium]|nr:putative diguanylate cyclase/phosphodiesterase with sensor [Acidimicrobiales bacterium]